MESLNMKNLANSLPNSANAEKQLSDSFKTAACSIAALYRSSLETSKHAHSAGYATCLQDILYFLQAGVSASGDAGEEMTIGKVMDWIEARLEAIKSTEEEEEEDRLKDVPSKVTQQDDPPKEDREKRERVRRTPNQAAAQSKLQRRSKDNLQDMVQVTPSLQQTPSPRAPASSPPRLHSVSPPPRPIRSKRGLKEIGISLSPNADSMFTTTIPTSSGFPVSSEVLSPLPPVVGSKRRHTTMITDSHPHSIDLSNTHNSTTAALSANSGIHSGFSRKKRGRNGHGHGRDREMYQLNANSNTGQGEDMEVEEDGRERKRVARR